MSRPSLAGWVGLGPGWSALGSGQSCVTDDCTGTYANAVDAAPGGIDVSGNFGVAGVQGSDNFACGIRRPGSSTVAAPTAGRPLARPALVAGCGWRR